jgi:hypothetical protein
MMTGGGANCQLEALIEVLAPFTRPAGPAGGARSSTVAGLAPARPNEKDMAGFGPAS